ncbi:hypothetical protein CALVIDRAFT_603468 [Calocera viscosa TUFC12733]|uniref:Uncharacterized protein n=1 Tax=Calocera viscosa (strain TUFC12733) TaxID=1330018 RepID=A0A167FPQ0_CALVF|nr:hypothetical protein CALVIDRAFT_603468 [Calocera viscosa TUFC12733]
MASSNRETWYSLFPLGRAPSKDEVATWLQNTPADEVRQWRIDIVSALESDETLWDTSGVSGFYMEAMGPLFQNEWLSRQSAARATPGRSLETWPDPLTEIVDPKGPGLRSVLEEWEPLPRREDRALCLQEGDEGKDYASWQLWALYTRMEESGAPGVPVQDEGARIMTLEQSSVKWTTAQMFKYQTGLNTYGSPPYLKNENPCHHCVSSLKAHNGKPRICFGGSSTASPPLACIPCNVMFNKSCWDHERPGAPVLAADSPRPEMSATPGGETAGLQTKSAMVVQGELLERQEKIARAVRRNHEVLTRTRTVKGKVILYMPETSGGKERKARTAGALRAEADTVLQKRAREDAEDEDDEEEEDEQTQDEEQEQQSEANTRRPRKTVPDKRPQRKSARTIPHTRSRDAGAKK